VAVRRGEVEEVVIASILVAIWPSERFHNSYAQIGLVEGHHSLHPSDKDLSLGTPVSTPGDEDLSLGTPVWGSCRLEGIGPGYIHCGTAVSFPLLAVTYPRNSRGLIFPCSMKRGLANQRFL
jgi:hypothetical protein